MKYSLLFLSLAHATLISSYIPPTVSVIQYIKYGDHVENSTLSLPTRLPYYSWMPFSYNTGHMYLLAMAYQAGTCAILNKNVCWLSVITKIC